MMKKSPSSKIMNFMAPGSGVLVLGRGSNVYIEKCFIPKKNVSSALEYKPEKLST